MDHAFEDSGRVTIACDGTPCLRPDGQVEATATIRVPLPLVPRSSATWFRCRSPCRASHLSTVDRFRGLP